MCDVIFSGSTCLDDEPGLTLDAPRRPNRRGVFFVRGGLIKLSSAVSTFKAVVEVAVVDVVAVVATLPVWLTEDDRGEVGGLFELIIKTPVKNKIR